MSGTLRQIALTVQQTGRGYVWVLIESADDSVFVLKKGERPFGSYLGALDAGYQELALLSACGLHESSGSRPGNAQAPRATQLAALHDAL